MAELFLIIVLIASVIFGFAFIGLCASGDVDLSRQDSAEREA